ncbi:MAG: exodeoxyribonuclease VII large subunit, partial [Thiotrichaceae bacterium]|nr:exodeoxyribonuclease VII large subunit [Thiotrichaceae bacterium]
MQSSNRTILNVSELNAEVNQLLTRGFPLLWVEGEISNLVRPASGHLYFTLKDNKSQIRSAMFRNRNMKLTIQPENGMKVLVRGRVGLYEPRGDYQLIAEHMEDAGIGQLQRQFEALKKKLSDAGLFAEEHKKELPEYPKRIGVITSPTGAAVRDILQVLSRRSPHTPVLIYPTAVQGEVSKTQIEMAIRKANLDKKCDVLILARGGGSIEDLWSFNEENVAKAVYNSGIPIVCGVGHEIDFTIADFVADLRAPT